MYAETDAKTAPVSKLLIDQVLLWNNHMVKGIMEKLTIAHLVKQFIACKILKVITVLTKVFYRILS
jgi:hypothetical protein